MRSFVISIYTLVLFTVAYSAPTDKQSANNCVAEGCIDGAIHHELAARGGENYYGPDAFNNFFFPGGGSGSDVSVQEGNGGDGNMARVTVVVTETATATATVLKATPPAAQLVPTPASVSSPHGNGDSLLGGLLGGLLPNSHSPSPGTISSNHNPVPVGIVPAGFLPPSSGGIIPKVPASQQPGGSATNNANQENQFQDHHLIDLDFNVTASIDDLIQATATVTVGLL